MSERSTTGADADRRLAELIGPAVAEAGLVLEDVALRPGGTGPVLRVLVDLPEERTGSVGIDSIAAAARAVSDVLDRTDPVPGSAYELEVSSPGATRELAEPRHWRRSVGRLVRITLVEGEKFTARLLEVAPDGVLVQRSHQGRKGTAPRLLDPERWAFDAVRRAKVEVEFTD